MAISNVDPSSEQDYVGQANPKAQISYTPDGQAPAPIPSAPKPKPVNTSVKRDKKISAYDLPPQVSQGFASLGSTSYKPQTVMAPPGVGTIASQYAVDPRVVAAAFANQSRTNSDIAAQQAIAGQQTQQYGQLRAAGLGLGAPSAAMLDNQALLHQAQALQTSQANSLRGGSEVRLAGQAEALASNAGMAQANIATAQALQAQEQEGDRAQAAQALAGQQTQDQAWLGAAYGIAAPEAQRAFMADTANQNALASAGIMNQGAQLQAAGADQTNAYNTVVANDGARTQAYRDQTGRQVAGLQGELSAAGLGIDADASAARAQVAAQQDQLARKRTALDVELAKKAAQQAKDAQDQQLGVAIAQGVVGLGTAAIL